MKLSKIVAAALISSQVLMASLPAAPVVTAEELENIEVLEEKPAVAEIEANNQPNRIVASFYGDTQTQMAFNWYTTDKFDDAVVLVSKTEDMSDPLEFKAEATPVDNAYAERTEDGYFIFATTEKDEEGDFIIDDEGRVEETGYFTDEGQEDNADWIENGDEYGYLNFIPVQEHAYKALATDLEPNTDYYYQVGSSEAGMSEVGKFSTSGEASDAFRFIHVTDTQNAFFNEQSRNEALFGADTFKRAIDHAEAADFVVHTGDYIDSADLEDEWIDMIGQAQESHLALPWTVVPGNHDMDNVYGGHTYEKFNEHFNVPITNDAVNGGSYYSFDYNGAHFVVANSNEEEVSDEGGMFTDEQLAWIKEDVEAARENGANWIILSYHKPLFSASYHSMQDEEVQVIREEIMTLIDDLDIDLVLNGHDHNLTRTKPLVKADNLATAEIDYAPVEYDEENIEHYVNPEGTIFNLPNTAGTKTYDSLYSKSVDHLHEVRPKLDWLTQEDMNYFRSLFAVGYQPQKSQAFLTTHSNRRDASEQSYSIIDVTPDKLTVKTYTVYGDLLKGEERITELSDSFGIMKKAE